MDAELVFIFKDKGRANINGMMNQTVKLNAISDVPIIKSRLFIFNSSSSTSCFPESKHQDFSSYSTPFLTDIIMYEYSVHTFAHSLSNADGAAGWSGCE